MPSVSDQFGPIFTAPRLEQQTTALLQLWFPNYLRELELQYDLELGTLVEPVTYTTRNTFDALPGEELPKCVVISPGIIGQPMKRGGGSYDAVWRLGVGVAIAVAIELDAQLFAGLYAAAARNIVLNQLPYQTTWLDEDYNDLPIRDKIQQYKSGACSFAVQVNNVSSTRGPTVPDLAPDKYNYGEVGNVIIGVNKVPFDEPVEG